MPYDWSDNTLHRLYQIAIVMAVFFIFQGLMFLQVDSMLLGCITLFSAPLMLVLDRQSKLETVIAKAVKKSKQI